MSTPAHSQQLTFDSLSIARTYVAAGLSVMPIARGTKEPDFSLLPRIWDEDAQKTKPSWRMYQERLPNDAELVNWFSRGDAGIAIIGGTVSGGLVVLDCESLELYQRWRAYAGELLPAALLDSLVVVATGKGRHVYLRMPDPIGNRKLAMNGKDVLIETRGEGGYVLAPPSLHPSGSTYEQIAGDFNAIPLLEAGQALALLDAARAISPVLEHPANSRNTGASDDVIGAFNQARTIEAILEAAGYTTERAGRYIRPGGERSSVWVREGRSLHYNTSDPLHSEAPGGRIHSHTPFSAWCILNHKGDVKAAVKAAAAELGMQRTPDDQALLAQAGRVLGMGGDTSENPHYPYFIQNGGFWMHRTGRDGNPQLPKPLCNFTAQVTAEITIDDGEHQEERYALSASCAGRTRHFEMRRDEFEGEGAVSKIVAALGIKARSNPDAQPRYILDAIKVFSTAVKETTTYTHTGWIERRYLFANGYVDPEGWHAAEGCQLPTRLQHYHLAPTPGAHIADALTIFDALISLGQPSIVVSLLGAILLAPIAATIGAPAPMVHLYGRSGSHKTHVACAAMALFGSFTPMRPTDSWSSTANSIQRLGWHLKDAPILVDDYKTSNVSNKQNVVTLLQNYGDGMARGRLDSNSELRSTYPVRGILVSTGEDLPAVEGEAAVLARILGVPITKGDIDRAKLTQVQTDAALLPLLTIDYLQWLAQHAERAELNHTLLLQMRASILNQIENDQEQAINAGRIASNAAAVYVAWASFGRYLLERQHWTEERVTTWLKECKRTLMSQARMQLAQATEERYSQVFLDVIRGLLAAGRAVLLKMDGGMQEITGGMVVLGGYDDVGTYLLSGIAYDRVCEHLRGAGRQFNCSQRTLALMLDQEGLLLGKSHGMQVSKRINRVKGWCWHLPPDIF